MKKDYKWFIVLIYNIYTSIRRKDQHWKVSSSTLLQIYDTLRSNFRIKDNIIFMLDKGHKVSRDLGILTQK